MADLLGVYIPSSSFTGSYGGWPIFDGDANGWGIPSDPDGGFEGICLTFDPRNHDVKTMRLRPTGPDGSGPYFSSRISGYYDVTSADEVFFSFAWHRAVNMCRFDHIRHGSGAMGKNVTHEFVYSNGRTAIAWRLAYAVPDQIYGSLSMFYAYSIEQATPPTRIGDSVWCQSWHYVLPYRVTEATYPDAVRQFRYLTWDVLTGAKTGHTDPILGKSSRRFTAYRRRSISLTSGDFVFNRGELTAFEWWSVTGALEGRYRALAGEAYYDAANNLPKAACNSIANVLDAAATVNDLIHGDIGKLIPTNPKDAWLFYRYQYSTSRMDIQEYKDLTERLLALASLSALRGDGSAVYDGISCHCNISVDPGYILPKDVKGWLKAYGFELSLYNIWDMIPYSFVVDWFLNIGTFLEVMESENWAYTLPVTEAWTSFTTYGPGSQSTYLRFPGFFRANCPFLDYRQRSASGKTIVKRILDSIALFT